MKLAAGRKYYSIINNSWTISGPLFGSRLLICLFFLVFSIHLFAQNSISFLSTSVRNTQNNFISEWYKRVTGVAITCSPTQTICIGNSATYTKTGTSWDATATTDCSTSSTITLSYSTDNGVTPSTGSTLSGAIFSVGSHTVTWTATDQCGNTLTCTSTIIINNASSYPALVAGTFTNTPVTACSNYDPAPFNLSGTTGGSIPYSYQWQLSTNNGSTWSDIAGATNATYDPTNITALGTYTFRAQITDGCGTIVYTATKTITIVSDPIVSISGNSSVCQNGNLVLTANVTGGTGSNIYQWQSGTSLAGPWTNIAGATSASYTVPSSVTGTFYYQIQITGGAACSQPTAQKAITVNAPPNISGNAAVCIGSTTQLTGSGSPASSNAWVSSNTGVATISSSGLVTGVSAGTSTITYTDNNGCSKTATITVTANGTITLNKRCSLPEV